MDQPWYIHNNSRKNPLYCGKCGRRFEITAIRETSYWDVRNGERIEQFEAQLACPKRVGKFGMFSGHDASTGSYKPTYYISHTKLGEPLEVR